MFGSSESASAVHGKGIYFYYDRKKKLPVLKDVNIAVPRGAIYSLLGPSGCGKTTLLKCVVGQHKLQEGSLKVYGRIPGSKGFPIPGRGVGYMPQELSLYLEMCIEEIMIYFGSLYGMNRPLIKERMNFLLELLALPEKKRLIKHLSGGQQRRVSFSIALLHKPPLLILDEPTVGVDPLLRQTIWDHLVALVNNDHLTIIITTHYTEEARQANVVGLMRNGHLLVEKNPEDLINEHGVSTLEEVFLKLCQKENDELKDHEKYQNLSTVESHNPNCPAEDSALLMQKGTNEGYAEETHLTKNGQDFTMIPMEHTDKFSETFDGKKDSKDTTTILLPSFPIPKELNKPTVVSAFLASYLRFICLTRKNFLRLKRNIFMLFFAILIPSFEIIIFCMCLSSNPFDLNVAVVNLDEDINKYGERFLGEVNTHTIRQIKYDNFEAAYQSVTTGESKAAVYINPEFSPCLVDRILEGALASNDTLQCSMVKMYLDNSNYIVATTIYVSFLESYLKFAKYLLNLYEKSPLLAESPVSIEEYVYGSGSATVVEFVAPAVLLAVAYIIAIGLTALSILEEKNLGLFERSTVAGATPVEILMSLFCTLLTVLFLQVIVMLGFAFFVFNIPYNGPLFWIFVATSLTGVCGMCYGFLISSLTDEIATAVIVAVGTFFPTLFLSGMIWPVEAMSYHLRYFSYCLPLTKMIESVRSIMTRGWTVSDYNIWDGYLICIFWTILPMLLCILVLKYKK